MLNFSNIIYGENIDLISFRHYTYPLIESKSLTVCLVQCSFECVMDPNAFNRDMYENRIAFI